MSNNYQDWDDEDFDLDGEEVEPRSANYGNDLVKKLRRQVRQLEKSLKEKDSEVTELRTGQRDFLIKNILAEKGLNEKVARFVPNDIEPTADALSNWINENADVFGIESSQPASQVTPDLATLRQIDAVTANAITPDKLENMLLRIDQANSAEEILSMIQGN